MLHAVNKTRRCKTAFKQSIMHVKPRSYKQKSLYSQRPRNWRFEKRKTQLKLILVHCSVLNNDDSFAPSSDGIFFSVTDQRTIFINHYKRPYGAPVKAENHFTVVYSHPERNGMTSHRASSSVVGLPATARCQGDRPKIDACRPCTARQGN